MRDIAGADVAPSCLPCFNRYAWAAMAKLDPDWLDGTVCSAILSHPYRRWAAVLLGHRVTSIAMAWGGLVVVALAPVGLNADKKSIRAMMQSALIGFHAANMTMFGVSGIGCFSVLMMVSLIIFPRGIVGFPSAPSRPSPSPHHPDASTKTEDLAANTHVATNRDGGQARTITDTDAKRNNPQRRVHRTRTSTEREKLQEGRLSCAPSLSGSAVRQSTPPRDTTQQQLPAFVVAFLVLQAVLPMRQFSDGIKSAPGWTKRHDRWSWRMKATVERMAVRLPGLFANNRLFFSLAVTRISSLR